MNNVVLIGRLTKKPELRYSPNQSAVTHFTLAVDRPQQQGKEKQADFIRVTVFGKQAESSERYLDKGRQCAVQGRIQTGSYQDKNGQTVYTTDVIASRVEFLGSGGGGNGGGGNQLAMTDDQFSQDPADYVPQNVPESFVPVEDDVPF